MIEPVQKGMNLLEDIEQSCCPTPNLWWLGHCGFVLKYHTLILYIDPYLSNSQAHRFRNSANPHKRLTASPLHPAAVRHADLVLCTHAHNSHLDPGTVPAILESSPRARLVLPKSVAGRANAMNVDYLRMTTMDADLRVDINKDGADCHIFAVPSAHESLDWNPIDGHPYLGYVIQLGDWAIYHAGDCVPYPGLAERLKQYELTVAILPINGRDAGRDMPGNFTIEEAAGLAGSAGARWLIPMHYDMFDENNVDIERFVNHMLGSRPKQRFKVFQPGERWAVPEE